MINIYDKYKGRIKRDCYLGHQCRNTRRHICYPNIVLTNGLETSPMLWTYYKIKLVCPPLSVVHLDSQTRFCHNKHRHRWTNWCLPFSCRFHCLHQLYMCLSVQSVMLLFVLIHPYTVYQWSWRVRQIKCSWDTSL